MSDEALARKCVVGGERTIAKGAFGRNMLWIIGILTVINSIVIIYLGHYIGRILNIIEAQAIRELNKLYEEP